MKRIYVRRPVADRFFEKVRKTSGCWYWSAAVNNKGYGQMLISKTPRHIVALAHRISWELAYGAVPEGMGVLHKCDTPTCVNPAHLFLGDQRINMADAKAKGRMALGESNGQHKLSAADVVAIRNRYTGKRGEQTRLARLYRVSRRLIGYVVHNKGWKHV
jgi:hypothetical protein